MQLEGMFNDLKTSAEFMAQYRASRGAASAHAASGAGSAALVPVVDIDVTVLTSVHWPSNTVAPCRLPADVVPAAEAFRAAYLAKHTGRRLTWNTSKGSADIKASFGDRRHELSVSTYQMCCLLLFNEASMSLLGSVALRINWCADHCYPV